MTYSCAIAQFVMMGAVGFNTTMELFFFFIV